jgi:WD40 repeat protein
MAHSIVRPTSERLRIFISYSRRDAEMADRLVAALRAHGFEVAIDRRDLEFGEKWQAELAEFVRLSDTVVWLVSEFSIRSEWVSWELDEVARRHKRLVPVMVGDTPRDKLPRQLGEIHILPAEGVFELDRDLAALVRVLETDRAWIKEASRLADRAHEWTSKGHSPALLLRSAALGSAEGWKDRRPAKAPPPAQETLDLILASRRAATRRLRWWAAGSLAVTAIATGLAVFAYLQRVEADHQRNESNLQREQAVKNEARAVALRKDSLLAQSKFLADRVQTKGDQGRFGNEMALLALEAVDHDETTAGRPYWHAAQVALEFSLLGPRETVVFAGHTDGIHGAAFAPDGQRIVTASADRTARLWHIDGRSIATLAGHCGADAAQPAQDCVVLSAAFSPDGRWIVTGSSDGTARVWSSQGRQISVLAHPCAQAPGGPGQDCGVNTAVFSPDGKRILTSSNDDTARLWEQHPSDDGRSRWRAVAVLTGHTSWVRSAVYSRDGQRILTASDDKTARLWDADGKYRATIASHDRELVYAEFAPDGTQILTSSFDRTVRLWRLVETQAQLQLGNPLTGHGGVWARGKFSIDGRTIVTDSGGGLAAIWQARSDAAQNREFDVVAVLLHEDANGAAVSPDGRRILTFSNDGTARLWAPDWAEAPGSDWGDVARTGHKFMDRSLTDDLKVPGIIELAKARVARCLTPGERAAAFLPEAPPRWCITGAGLETEKDADKWRPKWPYLGAQWLQWLLARDRGEDHPLPTDDR